jgi:hypothetical protein
LPTKYLRLKEPGDKWRELIQRRLRKELIEERRYNKVLDCLAGV